ncbi:MAG: hypothetical protein IKG98_05755 [Ruminococcus sp.]|nr:hypothetical protein [Ruminococcus sp.]
MSTTYTEHYNFGKQENYADLFSMKVITDNWDSLDAILYGFSTGKQDKLSATNKLSVAFVDFTPAQIAALGSGITDDDVEQIDLNKNNILSLYKVGSANILKNTAQTQTVGDVTFTMNADGTITANGTKTNNDWLYLSTGNSLKKGTYVLSSGGITGSDNLVIVTTGDTLGSAIMTTNTATGVYERELTQDYSNLYYAIRIASGTVCNNLTFKPMLCEKKVYEAINGEFQPYAMSNAELTAKEQQNKISFGFSGNPNPAVYVKDWDFVPDGTYLLTYICSQDASTRRGVSVYMFTKYTTNHIVLFTPVVEVSGAIITSCVASGSAGAETITFTMAQRGYHTAAAIQIQAF